MEMLTLLSTTQLLDPLLIIVLAIKADTDANPDIVLDTLASFLIIGVNIILGSRVAVRLALDNEATTAGRNQLLEHVVELARDLLECTLNGLVLALIKDGNK